MRFQAACCAASLALSAFANAQSVYLDDIHFAKVGSSHRFDFIGGPRHAEILSIIETQGAEVEAYYENGESLFLGIMRAGSESLAEAEAALLLLESSEAIEEVFPSSSKHLHVQHLDKLKRYEDHEGVARARLNGAFVKERVFQPDLDAPHAPDFIIVKYHPEERGNAAAHFEPAALRDVRGRLSLRSVKTKSRGAAIEKRFVVEDFNGRTLGQVLEILNADPRIEYAQPNYYYELNAVPNDTHYSSLWGMPKISAPAAWDTRTATSSGVVIAVTDTGLQYTHSDVMGNVWMNPNETVNGIDDDSNGYIDDIFGADTINNDGDPWDDHFGYHGTHVSGTIGAEGDNSLGVTGVAWTTEIMSVKIFSSSGSTTNCAITDGLDYARTEGATVVNASWSGGPYNPDLEDAIDRLASAGIAFVNAAGNNNTNHDVFKRYPQGYNNYNQITVAASNGSDAKASFSDYGKWSVDLAAPGDDIFSLGNSNGYTYKDGTSMAAPHVTGAYALAKSEFPWEKEYELLDRLRFSVDKISGLSAYTMTSGRLNLDRVLSERPRLFNMSARAQVNTGSQIMIGGFIVRGPNSKRVAVIGKGPSLGAGSLSDPEITIYSGSTVIGQNDDWGTLSSSEQAELTAAGVAPTNASESAWIATLSPGPYSVHLQGVGGGTGLGMYEVFDMDGDNVDRIYNGSGRCYVGTGSQIVIGGFIIRSPDSNPRRVVIRAQGPSLGSGSVSDTTLELYDKFGTLIASNDDWQDFDGTSQELEEKLANFGLAPSDSRESIIMMDLEKGPYTVQLEGKGGATGLGLIEVFEY